MAKIFYHNDADGHCAGAIVYQKYLEGKYIEVDYKDEINVDEIMTDETIIIVDFSFKPEVMQKVLEKTKNIIWIDHHKTAKDYDYGIELKGLRNFEDKKFAGCELAWMHFNLEKKMPRAVELIGDRDKWAWKFGKETAEFNQGLQLYPHQPQDIIWGDLLQHDLLIKNICKKGKICLQYRDNFCKDYADSYGFETEFEGHKCYALGLYMFGSEGFGERFKQYDMCLSFEYTGKNWVIGLYSQKPEIDCGKIAQKYGGGGHKGAAGFVSNKLFF